MPVYDLANAGNNHRFTILSSEGPVIVHNCVLGLGYMMGGPKLQSTLAKGALGGPPVHFSPRETAAFVNAYRRKNDKIVQGWGVCKQIIEDMYYGREGEWKCLRWEKNRIWLPNGMALKYPGLEPINTGKYEEWIYRRKGQPIKLYSGLLNENIVQALARIVISDQLLVIDERYRAVMMTHDENIVVAPTRSAQKCLNFMLTTMRTPPEWAPDLPLNAEGGFAKFYSK